MDTGGFAVRPGGEADFDGWFALFEAVAAEGKWIGRELPVDRDAQRRRFFDDFMHGDSPAAVFLAQAGDRVVGLLDVRTYVGIGEIGMAVDRAWRGRGVGSALMAAGVGWARDQQLHKMALQFWPHNSAARGLYEKFGFVQEGYLRRHYRRRNGELWDAVVMGLVLDEISPGSTIS
jgi:RimJ/RimL family protein N-acetyltransferase